MSDESYSGEEMNTDTGSFSVDDEDQLQSGDTLEDPDVDDVLDEGYSPPDRARGSLAFGTTAWEQSQDETIEQRIKQEVPDPNTAYGAPDNWGSPRAAGESGLDQPDMLGGNDPDAIPVDDDFVSDSGARAGRLVAPDQGTGEDVDQDEVAQDVGIDGAGASAEEAAMHIASDEPGDEPLGVDDVVTTGAADTGPLSEAEADAIRDEDESNELDSIREVDDAR